MSKKSFDKDKLNAINPYGHDENNTVVSTEKFFNVVPLIVSVDIEQNNRIHEVNFKNIANQNEIVSLNTNLDDCNNISMLDEIENSSTVFSSNSSINNMYSNECKSINNPTNNQPSDSCVPNNYIVLNIGSMQNCPGIEVGGQNVYNGPVTINHVITNHTYQDKNQVKRKWKKKNPTPRLTVTYLVVVLLLVSVIIILINNITSLIPTPQIFRQATPTDDPISSSEHREFENSTTNSYKNERDHADAVEIHWNCQNEKFFATYATTIVLLLLANFLIYLFMKRCKKTVSSDDGENSHSDTIVSDTAMIRVVSRTEWLAKPPKEKLTPLVLPSTRVIIAHTDTNRSYTQEMCSRQIRHLQLKHMVERGWDDIGYHFLVGGDGAIYVGRGWCTQGAHSKGFNEKSICIAFIGRFNITEPPECQLIAAQKLIEEGVKLKKLTKDYLLYGHRQLRPFDSPGLVLYSIIQKWAHWSEEIRSP